MPRKNSIKRYVPNSYYHVFNRANHGFELFPQPRDYWYFRECLSLSLEKLEGFIRLDVFCLMPNHFHLLLWQYGERDIVTFMRSLMGQYRSNLRFYRGIRGQMFESSYSATLQGNASQVFRTRSYILQNPQEKGLTDWPHCGFWQGV